MSLAVFLGFCVAIATFTLVFCIVERTKFFNVNEYDVLNRRLKTNRSSKTILSRGVFLLLFAILCIFAVWTAKSYIYPSNKEKMFSNVRYHALAHKGYQVSDQFYLAHGLTTNNIGFPYEALWDDKDGILKLDRKDSTLRIHQFCDPVFVRKKEKKKDRYTYRLQNLTIQEDVSNGFELYQDGHLRYVLEVKQHSPNLFERLTTKDERLKKEQILYISKLYKNESLVICDTSSFNSVIKQGYPLLDIIAHSPRIEITEEIEQWFTGCYLVRDGIPFDDNIMDFDEKNPSPLRIMPGLHFYLHGNLSINQKEPKHNFDTTFIVKFKDYVHEGSLRFFSGVGTHRSEEFILSYPDTTTTLLSFLQKDMRQLREMDGRVFITTSIDEIASTENEGGYYYNKFHHEKNLNHINASIRYKVGSARDSLCFIVMDLNNPLEDDKRVYKCAEHFLLKSTNKTDNSISWVFEVVNLRETNDLQLRHIIYFILFMFFAVSIRLIVDTALERRSLSLFEYGLYVVLFSLCVVRLILSWRASTFVPIEDITYPVYSKMRDSWGLVEALIYAFIVLLPILVSIYTIWAAKIHAFIANAVAIIKQKFSTIKLPDGLKNLLTVLGIQYPQIFLTYIGLLLLMLVTSMVLPKLERFCNILLPLCIFIVTEIWLEVKHAKYKHSFSTLIQRIAHIIVMCLYLFVADAGFIVVFLTYIILQEGVLKRLFNRQIHLRGLKQWLPYILSIFFTFVLWVILLRQGQLMIKLFTHTGWVIFFVGLIIITCGVLIYCKTSYKKLGIGVAIFALIITISGIVEAVSPSVNFWSDLVNIKAHMRYRAEIQQLTKGESVDQLIEKSDYDSQDIVYIMRSAHNQWFINQYIRAGQDMKNDNLSFRLQPHSNQGCTYTTQTTDLVVTRYILAEHGEVVARRILILWMLLILIFIMEISMSNGVNLAYVGSILLIYSIALLVYLSATNRVVFIGQDFPMISLQSRVAILFPYVLLCIPLFRLIYIRQRRLDDNDDKETDFKGIVFGVELILLTVLCVTGIEQKGKEQEASQFNVSTLISNMSDKVALINERFQSYQIENKEKIKGKKIDDIWNTFTDTDFAVVYNDLLEDTTTNNKFFSSSLRYFKDKQTSKTDINQLLHLRRRGGICYLAVNKQHYFIPAIMKEEMQWKGHLYAAYIDPNFSLYGLSNAKKIKLDTRKDYEINILTNNVVRDVPNMPLLRFDASWTPGDAPLLLLKSAQGIGQSEYFWIESDTLEYKSKGRQNQIATSVEPGDVFRLYRQEGNKQSQAVYSAKLHKDGTKYIARNIWLNGHRRLFYPLGKESMWSYHYANLVSSALGDTSLLKINKAYQDTSLRLSLDFDLCKILYQSIEKDVANSQNSSRMSNRVRKQLEEFKNAPMAIQADSLHRSLYYDLHRNKVIVKSGTYELKFQVSEINRRLKEFRNLEKPLSKAIDCVLQRPYDFTAVAIDGDGHIRALFDYTQHHRVDPNNIENMNKLISELYLEGSTADERDVFGNKALQHIPMGPGSSFKPIAYSAITSQEKLNWKSINVSSYGINDALSKKKNNSSSDVKQFDYYGGVNITRENEGKPLNIDTYYSLNYNNYLYKSDNLYHSAMIMLGLQPIDNVTNILRSTAGLSPQEAFPIITYSGNEYAFNPDVWYTGGRSVIQENSILSSGLYHNFHILQGNTRTAKREYQNYFGNDSIMSYIASYPSSARGWSFAECGSQNIADRRQKPVLTNGFNRMLLGAYPLQQTPMQMAVNTMRLVTLNKSESITTLMDGPTTKNYKFFKIGAGWNEQSYLEFMRDVVWTQMRKTPKIGTARGLTREIDKIETGKKYGRPYYIYCKTGTLADERKNANVNRIKHLMVVITDRELEKITSVEQLQQLRYYVVYLSYMGVSENGFTNHRFLPYIEDVMSSTTFQTYMNPKKNTINHTL